MNNKPLVLDCFPFSEELLTLEVRLHELNPVVDYFIICESAFSQSRLPKPYNFELNKDKFKDFSDKIIYLKFDECIPGSEGNWGQEWAQRNFLVTGIDKLSERVELKTNTIVMISDLDEIPRASVVEELIKKPIGVISLNHYFQCYYLNLVAKKFRDWDWYGTCLVNIELLQYHDFQWVRDNKDRFQHTGNSGEGWHLSGLLFEGFDSLFHKLLTRIEPTEKSQFYLPGAKEKYKQLFEKCVLEDKYFFFSDKPYDRSMPLEKLDISLLPCYIQDNIDTKFKHLII